MSMWLLVQPLGCNTVITLILICYCSRFAHVINYFHAYSLPRSSPSDPSDLSTASLRASCKLRKRRVSAFSTYKLILGCDDCQLQLGYYCYSGCFALIKPKSLGAVCANAVASIAPVKSVPVRSSAACFSESVKACSQHINWIELSSNSEHAYFNGKVRTSACEL